MGREPKITLVRLDTHRGLAHISLHTIKPEVGELLQRGCRQAEVVQQFAFLRVRAQPPREVGGLLRDDVDAKQGAGEGCGKLSAAIRRW